MPRKQKKYHYIYKTTCQVTGKFYVGMHSTDDLDDGYLGSGKILGYSIGKHGRENHKKEILEFLPDRAALSAREAEVVNEELLADPLCINLKYGGEGGGFLAEKNKTNDFHKLGQQAMMRVKDHSASSKKTWELHYDKMRSILAPHAIAVQPVATEAARQKAVIEKRKATYAERGHMQGEKNSQFGTCWVTNGVKPIKIKKENLDEYLANGYRRGREISAV